MRRGNFANLGRNFLSGWNCSLTSPSDSVANTVTPPIHSYCGGCRCSGRSTSRLVLMLIPRLQKLRKFVLQKQKDRFLVNLSAIRKLSRNGLRGDRSTGDRESITFLQTGLLARNGFQLARHSD